VGWCARCIRRGVYRYQVAMVEISVVSPCEIHLFDCTVRFTLQHFHSVAVILHMNNINLIVSFKIRFVIALLCQT
jgi:hypothetical protein